MTVGVWCPYGNHVWWTKSLDDFLKVMRSYSRFVTTVEPRMTEAFEEFARQKHKESLIVPSRSKLKRILKRDGFLTVCCLDCNAAVTQEAYRRIGIQTMKVGIILVLPHLIDDPRMQEQIKEFGLNRYVSANIDFDAILSKKSQP